MRNVARAGAAALSLSDLDSIATLLPRLISSGHLPAASRLLTASLLLPPPHPSFLPLSSLLSSLPDPAPTTYSLLTAPRLHPLKPSPLPLLSPLLSSFLTSRRGKDSAKLFFWLCRADSPHRPDEQLYRTAVRGFCELQKMLDVVRVLREMAGDGMVAGGEMRGLVYRGLLQEARIDEARELDLVLRGLEESGNGDGFGKAAAVLDRLISEWED